MMTIKNMTMGTNITITKFPLYAIFAGAVAVVLLNSCSSSNEPHTGAAATTSERTGRQLFANCQACHGLDGRATSGLAPGLLGSPVLAGPDAALITLILKGSGRDTKYQAQMPRFAERLSDQDIVVLVNWLRRQWAPAAPDISPEQVRALR